MSVRAAPAAEGWGEPVQLPFGPADLVVPPDLVKLLPGVSHRDNIARGENRPTACPEQGCRFIRRVQRCVKQCLCEMGSFFPPPTPTVWSVVIILLLAAGSPPLQACDGGTAVPDPENNPGLVADCTVLLGLRDELAATLLP